MASFNHPRPYHSTADLDAMRQVLQSGALANTNSHYVHTGDLNWWLFYPPLGNDLFQHAFVWDDPGTPGKLLGWMLVDPTWPSFEIFLQPVILGTSLAMEMFAYAEAQAYARSSVSEGKPMHKLWVAETDACQRHYLESRGFSPASWDADFRLSLDREIPAPTLPEGYALRPCRGLVEVEVRAAAQYGAFGGTAPLEQYLARFRRFMESPVYAGALDQVAVAPDGRIAAFCIAWSDSVTRTGHFEPVGTHPDFQRKGLGKAVMQAALQHFLRQGLQYATVCTPERNTPAVALYRSVGFEPVNRLGLYEKKLG